MTLKYTCDDGMESSIFYLINSADGEITAFGIDSALALVVNEVDDMASVTSSLSDEAACPTDDAPDELQVVVIAAAVDSSFATAETDAGVEADVAATVAVTKGDCQLESPHVLCWSA